jgi:hypothetical protein
VKRTTESSLAERYALQPSASRTSFWTLANPSDKSLGYFQSSANADSRDDTPCAKPPKPTAWRATLAGSYRKRRFWKPNQGPHNN